ncbi:MAG TPA: c-type cytochrome domain-containing protein [Leadbetterella sp.]|nr:c-type cytochrome domain-containing protein [Leadbetterella sp.]
MNYSQVVGQFHPLLVHLPIGILLFAFFIMLYQKWQKAELTEAISLALLLGSIGALLSCIAGWFLAHSGEYEAEIVQNHQWTAIASTVFGFTAYFYKNQRMILSTIMAATLTIAGHFGGTITHGEDYLFEEKEQTSKPSKTLQKQTKIDTTNSGQKTVRQTFLYNEKVAPILEKKCYSCHSSRKKKGSLRLDSETFIRKGGKNGEVLHAGNPSKSSLYANLLLPLEDEKHMPPKGKPQLTSAEISVLHYWIKKGASFTGEIEAETIIPQIQTVKLAFEEISSENLQNKNPDLDTVEPKLSKPDPQTLEKLKNEKIVINSEGLDGKKLSVNFVNIKNFNSNHITNLQVIRENIFSLKINNKELSDVNLGQIKSFENLEKLNLDQTAITDNGIRELVNLKNLKQLNLYDTEISDKSIEALSSIKNLKVLYLWKTKISESGIEQLKKKLPNTKIESGNFKFSKPDSLK